jgi:hypothetical protein
MASFSFLTGIDPNSLPARLRQQMAAPGLIPGPIQPMPLQSGFRAPPAMSMGAMPGMAQPQPQPGFNMADGAAMLSKGLAGFKMPKGGGNAGMPEDQNLGIPSPRSTRCSATQMVSSHHRRCRPISAAGRAAEDLLPSWAAYPTS